MFAMIVVNRKVRRTNYGPGFRGPYYLFQFHFDHDKLLWILGLTTISNLCSMLHGKSQASSSTKTTSSATLKIHSIQDSTAKGQ